MHCSEIQTCRTFVLLTGTAWEFVLSLSTKLKAPHLWVSLWCTWRMVSKGLGFWVAEPRWHQVVFWVAPPPWFLKVSGLVISLRPTLEISGFEMHLTWPLYQSLTMGLQSLPQITRHRHKPGRSWPSHRHLWVTCSTLASTSDSQRTPTQKKLGCWNRKLGEAAGN